MTPLILLVVFLGAGKTTLLRALLPPLTDAGLAPQVLINDYRNASLDASTMRGLAESIVPLTGILLFAPNFDVVGVSIAFAVAWSRVYMCAHHPSDVCVGAFLGLACGGALCRSAVVHFYLSNVFSDFRSSTERLCELRRPS